MGGEAEGSNLLDFGGGLGKNSMSESESETGTTGRRGLSTGCRTRAGGESSSSEKASIVSPMESRRDFRTGGLAFVGLVAFEGSGFTGTDGLVLRFSAATCLPAPSSTTMSTSTTGDMGCMERGILVGVAILGLCPDRTLGCPGL